MKWQKAISIIEIESNSTTIATIKAELGRGVQVRVNVELRQTCLMGDCRYILAKCCSLEPFSSPAFWMFLLSCDFPELQPASTFFKRRNFGYSAVSARVHSQTG